MRTGAVAQAEVIGATAANPAPANVIGGEVRNGSAPTDGASAR
jgi:hypothetical protein